MQMLASEALLKVIRDHGVDMIFGYPGAANTPIFDVVEKSGIKYILTRNEQGAAHAAQAYSKMTGRVGVCTATSGPGATNLVTGIANAYMDSVPLLAITGQVASGQVGRDAFQEVDMTGVTTPISKHNYLVKDAQDIPRIINDAFYIAKTGRPGPVVIDIPMDLQKTMIQYQPPGEPAIRGYNPSPRADDAQLDALAEAVRRAQKPLLVAGGGVLNACACAEFQTFVETLGIPVVSTMMGIGALPCDHPLYYGMVGSHGVKPANVAFTQADLVIFMGARVSDRAVGNPAGLEKQATVAHVDIDPAEIGKNVKCDISVVGGIKDLLPRLAQKLAGERCSARWADELDAVRSAVVLPAGSGTEHVNPKYFMRRLGGLTDGRAVITTEVGQNQIWAANNYCFRRANTLLTSGGFGTMGYGLPAALGAKLAAPHETVIAIEGDGSFQMSMPELGAIRQWGADVKIVLFVNRLLGMVYEYQDIHYASHHVGVQLGSYPHFDRIAAAYDIPFASIHADSDVDGAIQTMLNTGGAYMLEVVVDPDERTL